MQGIAVCPECGRKRKKGDTWACPLCKVTYVLQKENSLGLEAGKTPHHNLKFIMSYAIAIIITIALGLAGYFFFSIKSSPVGNENTSEGSVQKDLAVTSEGSPDSNLTGHFPSLSGAKNEEFIGDAKELLMLCSDVTDLVRAGKNQDDLAVFVALASYNGKITTLAQKINKANSKEDVESIVYMLKEYIDVRIMSKDLEDRFASVGATMALGEFGMNAKKAIPTLNILKNSNDKYTSNWSKDALKKIQGGKE